MASVIDIEKPEIVMEPFRSSGGTWSIPDTTLRMVWNKIERLGLEEIFYPILIESAEGFLSLCKRDTHGLFFLRRGNDFLLLSSLMNPGPGHIWIRFCPLELPFSIDLVLATERLIKSWFAAAVQVSSAVI